MTVGLTFENLLLYFQQHKLGYEIKILNQRKFVWYEDAGQDTEDDDGGVMSPVMPQAALAVADEAVEENKDQPLPPFRFTTLQALEKHVSEMTTEWVDGLDLFFDNGDVVQNSSVAVPSPLVERARGARGSSALKYADTPTAHATLSRHTAAQLPAAQLPAASASARTHADTPNAAPTLNTHPELNRHTSAQIPAPSASPTQDEFRRHKSELTLGNNKSASSIANQGVITTNFNTNITTNINTTLASPRLPTGSHLHSISEHAKGGGVGAEAEAVPQLDANSEAALEFRTLRLVEIEAMQLQVKLLVRMCRWHHALDSMQVM